MFPVAVVQATVDATGAVIETQPVAGDEAVLQAAAEAARRWRFQVLDQAPVTTLIGFNITRQQAPVPGAPIRNFPTWATAYVSRPLIEQWGTPSLAVVPPAATAPTTGVLVGLSVDGDGVPMTAFAAGRVDLLTLPALQVALAWRFLPRSDGSTGVVRVAVTFLKPPKQIKEVKAVYTRDAMQKRITGSVQLEIVIGVDGKVLDAVIQKSLLPSLDASALLAVRQWEFAPALRNGVPVEHKATVTVSFNLR
jgi:TonB family protein